MIHHREDIQCPSSIYDVMSTLTGANNWHPNNKAYRLPRLVQLENLEQLSRTSSLSFFNHKRVRLKLYDERNDRL
uniref:Uncharacterized protein n=1 Tax=Rhizophora mucronata TaxID=61149 RepID=A0A2P2QEB2_RHIMU